MSVSTRIEEYELSTRIGHAVSRRSAGPRRFEAAFRRAERFGDAEAMAEAALGIGGLWVQEHRTTAGSSQLQERLRTALALVHPRSLAALRLRVRLAGESSHRTGDPAAALAALDEARIFGNRLARVEALSIAHHCLLGPDHGELRRALTAELIGEGERGSRRTDLAMARLWGAVDLFLDGDQCAERSLRDVRDLVSAGPDAVHVVVDAIEVMLAIRSGALERAESLSRVSAQRGTDAGNIDAAWWHGSQLMAIRWYQGRLAVELPRLTELVASSAVVDNSVLAALSVAAAVCGDHSLAANGLATLCGHDLADLPRTSSWLITMNGIVEAAHLLDDAATAARAYQLLRPYAHLPMVGGLAIVCFGSVQHALGVACLTMGEVDRAVEHLHAAIRDNLALPHWPAVVSSRQRLAQALQRRGRLQDMIDADNELATAAREAEAVGVAANGAGPRPPKPVLSCTRQGRSWQLALGRHRAVVEHRIGLLHLAVLIANPGQEIDAADLAAGVAAVRASTIDQPVLDRVAIRDYQQRVEQLRREIDRLDARGDIDRADAARAERDWLVAELAGAAGFAGRTRQFSDNRERARIAVGKAIRRAVSQIAAADAAIGDHLDGSVRTGTRCVYLPA
jgi:hypothetical protein